MAVMSRIRAQDGSVMVTAILVTMLLLSVTLASVSFVDTQQKESGRERKREATFQLTEAVMNSQIFLLSRDWPGTPATQWPVSCSPANQADAKCPDAALLVRSFTGPDYTKGLSWTTEVHDNTVPNAENFYDDDFVRTQPRWDANGDSYLWIRAESTLVDGRTRAIVALVKAEQLATSFPTAALVAGSIDITQSGNHSYIYSQSSSGENGRIIVRCADVASSACVNEKKAVQISPAAVESVPAMANGLAPELVDRLREQAKASGTYYAAGQCAPTLAGALIFMENPTGCAYGSSGVTYNSATAPGAIIVGSGTFFIGHGTFYGLLYHVNGSDGVGSPVAAGVAAVTTKANSAIVGQIIIDGTGKMQAGNNNGGPGLPGNIVYNGNARNALKMFGTAGIVQNSFREIYAPGGGY
jgi:hypothetical protein